MSTSVPFPPLDTAAGVAPAFWLHASGNRQLPFVVSLLMYNAERRSVLPPAVTRSIDRVIEITGRAGLLTRTITDAEPAARAVQTTVPRALSFNNAVLLFRCQSAETAEAVMAQILAQYQVSLIKSAGAASA